MSVVRRCEWEILDTMGGYRRVVQGLRGGSDDKGGHLLGIVDAEIYLKKQEAENIRKLVALISGASGSESLLVCVKDEEWGGDGVM